MTDSQAVLIGTARTPFGKFGGALSSLTATTLAAAAIRGVITRSAIDPALIEHAIIGQVLQAGVGQAPVRQAVLKAGLATTVTGETVNKVCASGMLAIAQAARLARDGTNGVILAGGMESMSNAPYLVPGVRTGLKYGNGALLDAVLLDGLLDVYLNVTMANAAAQVAGVLGPARDAQDAFAYQSHRRASTAIEGDFFHDEIVPVYIAEKQRDRIWTDDPPQPVAAPAPADADIPAALRVAYEKYMPFVTGDAPSRMVEHDEAIRHDVSLAAMSGLRPLDAGGTVTAGNAPGLNDGAAMTLVASAAWAREHGITPLAEIIGHATVAWEPPFLALTPALAVEKLLAAHALTVADINVWEINEAFAAVAVLSAQRLGLATEAINRQGGAIALGHPLGASGARIVASVAHQLRRGGGGYGVAAICSGGGQGDAMLIRVRA